MSEFSEDSEKQLIELESTMVWILIFVKESVEKNYRKIDLSDGQSLFSHELYYCYDILQRFWTATNDSRNKILSEDIKDHKGD